MKKILIPIFTALFLLGCGNSSSSDKVMEIAHLYTVKKGDKVIKNDENISTSIKVYHTDGSEESVIELIEGKATIKRK